MSADLERALRELPVQWPRTPDVAAAVAERLAAEPHHAARPRRALAWAAAALALLLGGALAVEPARSALLDWLGFGSARIERRAPAVPPGRFGARLDLGTPVSLDHARREAGFRVAVPAALGRPAGIFLDRDAATGARVSFTYRPRRGLPRADETGVGLLITQFGGRASPVIGKSVGPGTTLEHLTVAGAPALWLSGASHGFAYEPGPGNVVFEDERLAGSVLLVDRPDGVLLRIEGRLTRDEAARIAASAR